VVVLAIGLLTVPGLHAAESSAAKPGCNGLIAFASNRAQDAQAEIYAIAPDGSRTDVSRSIGADTNPQPSPDGRKVAFGLADASAAVSLAVANEDGSDRRILSRAVSTVSWAPDSRHLATSENLGGRSTAVVFDVETGVATPLGPGASPQWSPDGSTIAFADYATDAQGVVSVERPDGSGRKELGPGHNPIWSPDGVRLVAATTPYSSEILATSGGQPIELPSFIALAWTSGGSRVVGVSLGGESTLESIAPDGADPRIIGPTVVSADNHLVSPDGHSLVFVRGPDGHLVVTDLGGNLLRDFGRFGWPSMTRFDPRWSPDGEHILLWSDHRQVIVADVETGAMRTLAGGATETTDEGVWSPDGSVLDSITDTKGNTDIYVSNPDGSGVRLVFADPVPEDMPVWSPGGTRLAFIREGAAPALVVTDLHGHARTLRRFANATELGRPAWSADETTIAVSTVKGFYAVNAHTGTGRFLRSRHDVTGISPDRRSVAYIYTVKGTERIAVDALHGTRLWSVPVGVVSDDVGNQEPGIATDLAWSPDGRRLAYIRFGTGEYGEFGYSIRILDRRSGRLVARFPTGTEGASWSSYSLAMRGFDWSPDSRYLIEAGFDAEIATIGGKHVAWLRGLRAVNPSWQPLCKVTP
jgi:Tol biopolymer transport system component